jgi:hypothetical protein
MFVLLFYIAAVYFIFWELMHLSAESADFNYKLRVFMENEYKPKQLISDEKLSLQKELPKKLNEGYRPRVYLFYLPWLFWSLVGVASSQWWLFVFAIVMSLLLGRIMSFYGKMKWESLYKMTYYIKTLINLGILFFILINKFHLHIKLTEIL